MKRLLTTVLMLMVTVTMLACSSTPTTPETTGSTSSDTPAITTPALAFEGQEEVGDGELYLSGPGGSTENGQELWIMDEDYSLLQIGVNATDMNGNTPTIFYINGNEFDQMQLANSQSTLELTEKELAPGNYNVEAVQKDGDNITFYRLMKYKVE